MQTQTPRVYVYLPPPYASHCPSFPSLEPGSWPEAADERQEVTHVLDLLVFKAGHGTCCMSTFIVATTYTFYMPKLSYIYLLKHTTHMLHVACMYKLMHIWLHGQDPFAIIYYLPCTSTSTSTLY